MIKFAGAVIAASRDGAHDERELAMSLSKSNARPAANRPAEPASQSDKFFVVGRFASEGWLPGRGCGAHASMPSRRGRTTA
jgi:hypothetical protein